MIIYGKQLFLHFLKHHKDEFEEIYLAKECDKKLFSDIVKVGVKILKVDNKKAQALAKGGNHQGFLAKVKEFEFADFKDAKMQNFVAVLYNLNDVGNIGAILRTAYALGVGAVIVVAKDLAMQNILRASSGAACEIPIVLMNDGLSALNELKQAGFRLIATSADGVSHTSLKRLNKTALVMGSEGEGLPKKVYEKCDICVGIEMKNSWDSLNVSAAFAIICDRMMNG